MNKSDWEKEPDLAALHHAHGLLATKPAEGLQELKALADRGSLMSMVYLGDAYEVGTGTNVDFVQAEDWYRRAAQGGSAIASYHLGRKYLERRDYLRAEQAFKIGASENYPPSIRELGRMYSEGIGVERDPNRARELLERASELGNVFAKRDLAFL